MLVGKGGELRIDGELIGQIESFRIRSMWLTTPIRDHAQWWDVIAAAGEADPAPALVFADWLDEQGDPRGEMIRCEVEYRQKVKQPATDDATIEHLWRLRTRWHQIAGEIGIGYVFLPEERRMESLMWAIAIKRAFARGSITVGQAAAVPSLVIRNNDPVA